MLIVSGDSLRATRTRCGALPRRTLSALIVATLAAGMAGCAAMGGPAGKPAAAAKKEPFVLLRLGERKVYVMEDEGKPASPGYPVAIGKAKYPTPTGRFQVSEMVKDPDFLVFDFNNPHKANRGRIPPGPRNPLGQRWIAFTSAHGWAVGFHGTTKTELLGQAVSHGCVRMSNPDIVQMFDRIKLGTPVVVEQ